MELRWHPYAVAFGAMGVALLLRWALGPWLGSGYPFASLYGAVAVGVWVGGWKPALAATLFGYAIGLTFFVEPIGTLGIRNASDVAGTVLFWISCTFIISLGEAMRRARDRHREAEALALLHAVELERADANKSHFLALLAHELRNPMAPLTNGLALLRMSSDPEAAARTHAMMERQLRQLRRLVDDLLDVSRIDRGKVQLRRERLSLDTIIRNALDSARPGIEAKKQELAVRYAPEALHVDGDLVRLSQVVANLLNNASKFTPPGGRIQIATISEPGFAVVRVVDNGMGFDPADAQRIFEMFVQLDTGLAHTGGGLGLGLALVRSLVELHGGAVTAHSAGAGKGAEFVVRLPVAEAVVESQPVREATLAGR